MRPTLLIFTLILATQTARAATAYEALRILGNKNGEAVLDNITEVHGEKGSPQPSVWKVLVKDSAARGGAREFSITGARFTGEQAARGGGSPMNMSQLNLDSDGAHTIAEREAKKAAFPYDHASYTLRAGSKGGAPVWEIHLTDHRSGSTATLNIAATTGAVLATEGLSGRKPAAVPHTPIAQQPTPAPRVQPLPDEQIPPVTPAPRTNAPPPNRAGGDPGQFFNRVGNHMSRRGRQIDDFFHNLFTGDSRDTAGPHGSHPGNTPPPPASRDEDFVKPSRIRD